MPRACGRRPHGRELAEALAQRLAEIRPAAARRCAGPAGGLPRSGHGPGHRRGHRARPGPGRRRGRFGPLPRTPAAGRVRRRHVPAADGDLLRRSRSIRWPTRSTCSPSSACSTCRAAELIDTLGPSLVVTALTDDPRLERDLLGRHEIGRLNLGPVPTSVLQWDQPHEGNIFTHLYQQRAFQRGVRRWPASLWSAATCRSFQRQWRCPMEAATSRRTPRGQPVVTVARILETIHVLTLLAQSQADVDPVRGCWWSCTTTGGSGTTAGCCSASCRSGWATRC